jgi:drug/metabolite transporter (DMT)-like permease
MVERFFAYRSDRLGALRRSGGDRAHRVAIPVSAKHATFEASPTTALALRPAILFDHSERIAVRELQLSETATISFLTPVFVALLAGPVLGERVSAERMIAIALGFLGVVIATRPGAGALQPIVLLAVAGVVCNSLYVLATRKLAGADSPQTTLAWTQVAGLVFLTPMLPWVWKQPGSAGAWVVMAVMGVFAATSHGMLIVAHRYAPAPTLTPFTYTQLIWMIISGVVVFGQWPAPATLVGAALVVACGAYLAVKERKGRGVPAAVDADRKV